MNTRRKRLFHIMASVILAVLGFSSCAHHGSSSDESLNSKKDSDSTKCQNSNKYDGIGIGSVMYGSPTTEYKDSIPFRPSEDTSN